MNNTIRILREVEIQTAICIDDIGGEALTVLLEEEIIAKPNKFGDCSSCDSNDCFGCKYYL